MRALSAHRGSSLPLPATTTVSNDSVPFGSIIHSDDDRDGSSGTEQPPIVALVADFVPGSSVLSHGGEELKFRLPKEAVPLFPGLLRGIEARAPCSTFPLHRCILWALAMVIVMWQL
jgi:hypothetical protein